MGEFAGGLMRGIGAGQQQAQEREFKRQTLDLARKKFKLEEEESGLKIEQLRQQLQRDPMGVIREFSRLFGPGQQGQEDLRFPSMGGAAETESLALPQTGMEGGVQTPTIPTPPSQAGAQPGLRFEPSFTVDEKGGVSVTLRGQQKKFSLNTSTVQQPDGTIAIVGSVFDPDTGQVVQEVPIGQAAPPATIQIAGQIAESFGAPRGSPYHAVVRGQVVTALQLPETTRAQGLAQIEAEVKQHRQPQPPAQQLRQPQQGGGLVSGAIAGTEEQQARKLQREEEIKLRMQPLSATLQDKVRALSEAENLGHELKQNFRPEFVGKGFQAFRSDLKDSFAKLEGDPNVKTWNYVPGGLAGGVRQFFGNISPEEVKFRKTVTDLSDLILRFRSGAQINEEEFQRLKKTLFELMDEPQVFGPSLDRFLSTVGRQIETTLKTASTPASKLLQEREQGRIQILKMTPRPSRP